MGATLQLRYGIRFDELYSRSGLARLDSVFLGWLQERDEGLAQALARARGEGNASSELLLALAPHLEAFLSALFGIETELDALVGRHLAHSPLWACKRQFVQRKAGVQVSADEAARLDGAALASRLEAILGGPVDELTFAASVMRWLEDEDTHARALGVALEYAAWALHTEAGRARHAHGVLFKRPAKWTDASRLVPISTHSVAVDKGAYAVHSSPHLRRRQGFGLTDAGTDLTGALDQANYCIWCHEQGRDSCSRGLREKTPKDAPPGAPATFRKNAFGVNQAGCPLSERISEFQKLKAQGVPLGALAMIVVDNPMVAATGHRICNDCMKACVYQKQAPVDIPQAETRVLKDALALPWGFEIYSLLTRWNPLNVERPLPRVASGRRVLVAGMGPAGFTLAHHLLNDGHAVVGIDGLKIEPLPDTVSGVDAFGARVPFEPIRDVDALYEPLDERVTAGFGGVAEYGITVRWNKNYLKLVRLLLERRSAFSLIGGVRFGGTLSADDAFDLGFDHVALALGAGRPTMLDVPNGLARGVRAASDFLMALQLTGAAKEDSIANLEIRLPVVVIGGGLTALDTATEVLAYYPLQVEKFLRRYETLCARFGAEAVRSRWRIEEAEQADEFIAHARALRAERDAAKREQRAPRLVELVQSWGGVTIAYRKRLVDSPSYALNHEEVEKGLEEGVRFAECLSPLAVQVDAHGAAAALRLATRQRGDDGKWSEGPEIELPARTILVAAGTQPNTVLAREDSAHFALDGRYFQACDEAGAPVKPAWGIAKPDEPRIFAHRRSDGRMISFFGDLHPSYFGNVVKAMGSAKQGYPAITRVLNASRPASSGGDAPFLAAVNARLRARVQAVHRLTPNIVEIVLHAPQAARNFRPGQFYRLQNFESRAPTIGIGASETRLAMEGVALTGAWVDVARGLVATIVLEMGGASSLCTALRAGEPVVLMGPTGAPTEIPRDETVVLAGGGLGNAVLFSIGVALRNAGCKVLYFAGYKKRLDRYKADEIEAAADAVVWCCDEAPGIAARRAQDKAFVGNIVQAMAAYAQGELGAQPVALADADRIIAIGSDRMMAAVAAARHSVLRPFLKRAHVAVGSINSPMQCMLKEICGQCMQLQVDPVTGSQRVVFSCFEQDQGLDAVDWSNLGQRLRQNSVQEALTAQWIALCLEQPRSATLKAQAEAVDG